MKAKDLYAKAEHLKQRYSQILDHDRPLAEQIYATAEVIEHAAKQLEWLEGLLDVDELEGIDNVGFGKGGRP